MKRMAILAAGLLAACGGGGGNKGNPAAAKTFDYGAPQSRTAPSSTTFALSSATSFPTTPTADAAMGVGESLFSAADELLGGTAIFAAPVSRALPLVRAARSAALGIGEVPGSSLPAGCYTIAGGVVTFRGCRMTQTDFDGTTVTVTLDGTVTGVIGSVTWGLDVHVVMASPDFALDAHYGDDGTFTVTESTAKAHQEVTLSATGRGGGQSATLALAQAADLDVTTVPPSSCASRVTGGTFEAKRVWTAVPNELRNDPQAAAEFKDRGVKLTWTGCGTATAQFSVN